MAGHNPSNRKYASGHNRKLMPLGLRQLELFRLVMQTRNVTETARLRRISQPAVSQAIKDLEADLGLTLFVRHAGRISPTAEARTLLRDVDRLFAQVSAVESRAAELRDAQAGSLTVASLHALTGSVIPRAIALLRTERPRVRISMNGYTKEEVIQQVRDELIDVGFVYAPVDDPQVAVEPIMRSMMICLLPTGHPLGDLPAVRLSHLIGETVIMHPTTPSAILLRGQMTEIGMRVEASVAANQSFGATALVHQGLGVFVTEPLIVFSPASTGLIAKPFEPPVEQILTMIYSRHRPVSRLVVRFNFHMRSVMTEIAKDLKRMGVEAVAM